MDNLQKKKSILCWFQYHETYFNDNVIWKLWKMCSENKWRIDALANGWGHCTRWNNAYKQMKFCCLWSNQAIMFKYPHGFLQTWQKRVSLFFCIKYKDVFEFAIEGIIMKQTTWLCPNSSWGFFQMGEVKLCAQHPNAYCWKQNVFQKKLKNLKCIWRVTTTWPVH